MDDIGEAHRSGREGPAERGAREGFRSGGRLVGPLRLPGSKSLAQRALGCAALCDGVTSIHGVDPGQDVEAMARALEGLGVQVDGIGTEELAVRGRSVGRDGGLGGGEDREISLGESGTAARLLTAASALCGRVGSSISLVPTGTLRTRTSPALFESLRVAGARLSSPVPASEASHGWPVRVEPVVAPGAIRLVAPSSSQELSGLLIASAAWPRATTVECEGAIPSAPYVEMTRAVLATFGVRVDRQLEEDGQRSRWTVRGPLIAPEDPLAVEPDASAAAVALAAACLSGGELTIPGLGPDSPQGDVRIAEYLREFGCEASLSVSGISARGAPRRGCALDLSGEPDLAPVLVALAAAAALKHGAASELTGLGTLQGKESRRIDVLAQGLRRIGLGVRAGSDRLSVEPGTSTPDRTVVLDPHGDHRMAFCFGLLGLSVPGVEVRTPECVAKSWPGFWEDMRGAGLKGLHPA